MPHGEGWRGFQLHPDSPHSHHPHAPHGAPSQPAICYSDDCAFVRPSPAQVEESIQHCLALSRNTARIANPLKGEFFIFS